MSSCGAGFVCNINGKKDHDTIIKGIEAVKNLSHRGAIGSDGKTGDGSGILIQVPKKFFLKEMKRINLPVPDIDNIAVGSLFFYAAIEDAIESVLKEHGFRIIGWREVPTDNDALGKAALSVRPVIKHVFIDTSGIAPNKAEALLYLAGKVIERTHGEKVYISSLSLNTVSYKGMLAAAQLDRFYPDLSDIDMESSFCLFHQRFSTNTLPDWTMSQPLRVLAHNGEINTIQGNRNWLGTMERTLANEVFGDDPGLVLPLFSREESDSSSLDRVVELLMLSGFSPEHAINMCVPPAWETSDLDEETRAFFEYQSLLMKPWDGPAAIVFTNGRTIGAHLDRNGLRPLRYTLTVDGLLVLGSEAGMIDLGGRTKEKGRLGPGDTISVDTATGRIKHTGEVLRELAGQHPYTEWVSSLSKLGDTDLRGTETDPELIRKQIAFGYTSEEIQTSVKEAAERAGELTYSMGDDTPLPSISEKPGLLFRYFKQRFSQVTNPPIDHIRERSVMSLRMNLGQEKNFLAETPSHAHRLRLDSPVLMEQDMSEIKGLEKFKAEVISINYPRAGSGLLSAVHALERAAIDAVNNNAEILVLSDKGISPDMVAIPGLLAVSAAFKSLQRRGIANRASLIVETGEAREIHHMACLIGYGASAIHPYLAFQTIGEMCSKGEVSVPYEKAASNYRKALEDSMLKVMARMGISALDSYHGAQLFDSICLNAGVIDRFFSGTPVVLESDGMEEIEGSLLRRHDLGFKTERPVAEAGGDLRQRQGGQRHAWSPAAVIALHKFIKAGDYGLYSEFVKVAHESPVYIRDLFAFRSSVPIAMEEVESVEAVLKRFFSGAMSVGALSPEAHETIAEACNSLGIKSNSGEGGEESARYRSIKNSSIKQVASGRFGVTPSYLASADEIEIKIAQGAKPGEGGHLPANKVTGYVAGLRHCNPNILLISPPPHHDIYSIEDLNQLINDLKQANPAARVCVKLVSETGIGAVAAGVTKAYADIIQISGCDGGTGASPIGSIKNAGNYWEIGLAETQRVLMENGLRGRVKLRVDGGMRTGRDIVIAAILGAEEFGFGTATMVAAGCVMVRQCHLNTCPKGLTTQDERLRKKFTGTVEGIAAYYKAVAREVREIMAGLGIKSLDGLIGRTDLIELRDHHGLKRDNDIIFRRLFEKFPEGQPLACTCKRNDNPVPSMNEGLLKDMMSYIENATPVEREYPIRNTDRSVPIRLNYHIAVRYLDEGLPPDTLKLNFRGTAGQSFGAFNHKGLSLVLIGEANDYAGKGMFGGRIVIKPSGINEPHKHVIAGNTLLYGATGGEFFASGIVGERFCVRNSGAVAVVEGAGHHLCEYMTRGTVVVLGETGSNIGAGMTGGAIYLLDNHNRLEARINKAYVRCIEVGEDADLLRSLIEAHYCFTDSPLAEEILNDFGNMIRKIKKVVPL